MARERLRYCLPLAATLHAAFLGLLSQGFAEGRSLAPRTYTETLSAIEFEQAWVAPQPRNDPAPAAPPPLAREPARDTLVAARTVWPVGETRTPATTDEPGETEGSSDGPSPSLFDDLPLGDFELRRPEPERVAVVARAAVDVERPSWRAHAERAGLARRAGRGQEAKRISRHGLGGEFGNQGEDLPIIAPLAKEGAERRLALRGELCHIDRGTRSLRHIERCRPIAIFHTDTPDTYTKARWARGGRNEWYAINYVGKFRVLERGSYRFSLTSHDGAILWIDGQEVIDNDGRHRIKTQHGSIELAQGEHRIRLMHFRGEATVECGVDVTLPLFAQPNGERRPPPMIKPASAKAVHCAPQEVLELNVTPPGKKARLFRPEF